jgi:hypothetical protein
MLQLIYISTLSPNAGPDPVADILSSSRRNNSRNGISGVLLHRGRRFLQVLEGHGDGVLTTLARIRVDPRHRAIVALGEREIECPEFGTWSMASDSDMPADRVMEQIEALTRNASPNVRALFNSYAAINPAA